MDCQCDLREKEPDLFIGIPDGFCGRCDFCKEPGHTRAHPKRPYTGSWCDSCYQQLPSAIPAVLYWICILGAIFLFLCLG